MTEASEVKFGEWLKAILVRDLKGLKRELDLYANERDMWKTAPGISNSAGNLALHMVGNLRHFIGAQLGHSSYQRNRDAEFKGRDMPRAEIHKLVDMAIIGIEHTLPTLTDADYAKTYPLKIAEMNLTTGEFLMHLAVHLTYHLGQVDYHRRMVTGQAGAPGVVSPLELSSATA